MIVRRYAKPLAVAVFIEVPVLMVAWLAWFVSGHGGGGDFAIFRRAGAAVWHGHTPSVPPIAALYAANDRFVYPTPFALPFMPFAALGERTGAVVFLLLSAASVLLAVRLLGVRDRRCYGAALLGAPVFGALGVGAIGPLLLVLLALAWRYRDRPWAGVFVAVAAAAKIFAWPVLVWLIATRRYRATAAAGITLAAITLTWVAIDVAGFEHYSATLRVFNAVQRWKSYSIQGLAASLGLAPIVGEAATAAVAVAGVAAIIAAGRRRDDRVAFSAAVVVALVATPILWLHYLTLLIIPIALLRPRLAPLWFLPVALWATPHPESAGVTWRAIVVLAALGVVASAVAVRDRSAVEMKPASAAAG